MPGFAEPAALAFLPNSFCFLSAPWALLRAGAIELQMTLNSLKVLMVLYTTIKSYILKESLLKNFLIYSFFEILASPARCKNLVRKI
jgi:hypothetical protein